MMSNKMICEPNLNLPQKFDINMLRKSDEPYSTPEIELKTAADVKTSVKLIPTDYNILPRFNHQDDNLKSVLSFKENDYLLCRWDRFLSNVPESFVRVRLYTDVQAPKPKGRRMMLNGQFYGVDNKLAPVPVSPDPRQYVRRPPKSILAISAKNVTK